jgi:hypothetical protein
LRTIENDLRYSIQMVDDDVSHNLLGQ